MSESTDNTTAQPLDVEALAALEQAASPAPWTVDFAFSEGAYEIGSGDVLVCYSVGTKEQADLIVAMRNQLPALLTELAKVTAERDEARGAVLELGDAIIRANGWEPQNGVTVELSSALERLVVQRDLLREGRDQYKRNWDTARREAEQARAAVATEALSALEKLYGDGADDAYFAVADVLKAIKDAILVAAPKADEPKPTPCGSFIRTGVVGSWYIACGYCKWQAIAHSQERADQVKASHDEVCPVALPAAAPVVPACADAGVHETNGIYREPATKTAGAGDGEQDATTMTRSGPCATSNCAFCTRDDCGCACHDVTHTAPGVAAPDADSSTYGLMVRAIETKNPLDIALALNAYSEDADGGETEVTA